MEHAVCYFLYALKLLIFTIIREGVIYVGLNISLLKGISGLLIVHVVNRLNNILFGL